MSARVAVALPDFTAGVFQPLIGRQMAFLRPAPSPHALPARVELELIEVRVPGPAGPETGRQPFSLLFTLRGEQPLDDRLLHRLAEPGFEACELLLSRVFVPELDRHDGTMYYEAAFG